VTRKENDEKDKLKVMFKLSDLFYSKIKDENVLDWEEKLNEISKEYRRDRSNVSIIGSDLAFVERVIRWLTATIPERLTLDLQNVEKVMDPIKESIFKKIYQRVSATIEEEMENTRTILIKLSDSHYALKADNFKHINEKVDEAKRRLLKNVKREIEIYQKTSGLKSCEKGQVWEQKKQYEDYEYKCFDKIDIPGNNSNNRSNEIFVNGVKIKISDSIFLLLLRLIVELKKGKGGWVNKYTLHEEQIVTDPDKYQIYSNLRSALQGSLLNKDAKKFIENDGSKNYRISTCPDFITYNKEKLLNHKDSDIKKLAEQLS